MLSDEGEHPPETHFFRAGLWARLPGHAAVISRLTRDEPFRIALTFDDGPHAMGTPPVLDALAAVGARATFFMVVQAARSAPHLVERIAASGHTVALHADVHERLDRVPIAELTHRLEGAARALEDVGQQRIRLFRPPFGAVSRKMLRAAHAADLDVVLWSHDPKDWQEMPADELRSRIAACLHPGAVVVLHDGPTKGRPVGVTTANAIKNLGAASEPYRLVAL